MEQSKKNRDLQKKRTILYFIQAAEDIIAEKGVDKLTVREVADKAGYNIATLYNYFENINHLVLFTSIKYLNQYVTDLSAYVDDSASPEERFYGCWECFCRHAFTYPEVFHVIFFGEFSHETVDQSLELYYELFPDNLKGVTEDFLDIMTSSDFIQRNIKSFQLIDLPDTSAVPADQKLYFYSELTSLIFQSMLYNAMEKKRKGTLSVEEETEAFFRYLAKLIES